MPPAHSHVRNYAAISPLVHTNNMTDFNLYSANTGGSIQSGGHYLIALNASTTFTLRNDNQDNFSLTSDSEMGSRLAGVWSQQITYGGVGYGKSNLDYGTEITVTFVQDNVGGWTPTVFAAQNNSTLSGATWGSGTAGQMRTGIYRYLGPLVGWELIYLTSAWKTFPYTLAPSSTRGGQYLRAVVGTGGSTFVSAMLDAAAKTPLNYRKALYNKGVILEAGSGGAVSVIQYNNDTVSKTMLIPGGVVIPTIPRHMVACVSDTSTPIATIHEMGHCADFLLSSGPPGYGETSKNLSNDMTLISYWNTSTATWGMSLNSNNDAVQDFGWAGSHGYFIRQKTEWLAQVLAAYMHRKWCVANAASTATADATLTKSVPPSLQSTVTAYLDTLLAAYIT
jgi:hypothetical protein